MRVTIEGNLTTEEIKELVEAVQRIDKRDPQRVVSLMFHEHPASTVEEWLAFCDEVGLSYSAIMAADEEIKLDFARGGSVRLVPRDPDGAF